jgi:Bacterial regulatory proteins, luxR family
MVTAIFQGKRASQMFSHLVHAASPIWPCECKIIGKTESRRCRGPDGAGSSAAGWQRPGVVFMEEKFGHVGPREQQIVELLLQGCDNSEIAKDLNIAERTVKAHLNRLFLRFGIKGGIKRVKLATLFYRRQLWLERQQPAGDPANGNSSSFNA